MDTSTIQNAAVATLIEAVNGIITGANEDIQVFANAIVSDGLQAVAEGKLELLPILADQTQVLAEKQRLQVLAAGEAIAGRLVLTVLTFASKLVIPTIPPL